MRLPKQVPSDTDDAADPAPAPVLCCIAVMVVAAERISVTLRHTKASCTGSNPASPKRRDERDEMRDEMRREIEIERVGER